MKTQKIALLLVLLLTKLCYAQVGIKVETPLTDLHVNGNVQITKEIRLGGNNTTLGDPGIKGQILKSNGDNMPASWVTLAIPEVPSTISGSLIAVEGKMQVAEEITALVTSDFETSPTDNNPQIIRTLNTKIIDTYNNLSNGKFKVNEDGIYSITINAQLSLISIGTSTNPLQKPVIGLWDESSGKWLARVNDSYNNRDGAEGLQCYTLITAVQLRKNTWYSFRLTNPYIDSNQKVRIMAESSGTSGAGPVSYFSLKRLK
ncbi:hypothetical protein [Myroides odoratus]|uniref:hypothetical protein n=1 Tax=Myroides odoratus TaxID=256 RepID=UPI003340C283